MRDLFDLSNRVAIITGGGGLLGGEFALTLLRYGATVVLVDLDEQALARTLERCAPQSDGRATALTADITRQAAVTDLVRRVVEQFGHIDILVNNATKKTSQFFASFETFPAEDWRQVIEVDLTGTFLCSQQVGREMARRRQGNIVNISSIYGVVAPDQRLYDGLDFNTPAVYSVVKAGLLGLTRYLAAYWGDQGIRVNAITPGGVRDGQPQIFQERYAARTPLGRMAERTELGAALLFLVSDASSYVTGQNLIVDGGWTAW